MRIPDGGFGNDLALDDAGGVYVTDSRGARVLYLAPGAAAFATVAQDARFRAGSDEFGPAGIARAIDGSLIMGLFSAGALFRIVPERGFGAAIEAIALPRRLENPDGLAFGPDGRLLVVEGAHTTGAGKLLAVELGSSSEPGRIEVVADGLANPANLTTREGWVWITELSAVTGRYQVRAYAYPYRAPAPATHRAKPNGAR